MPPPPPSNTSLLLGPPAIRNGTSSSFSPAQAAQPVAMDPAVSCTAANPCVDFFFQVVPGTPSSTVTHLLGLSWAQDPVKALKLVCNLRGVRGTGKNDKAGFYACALWIHENHPRTLALNVASLAEFGYMKDLLEILHRLLHFPSIPMRKMNKDKKMKKKKKKRTAADNADTINDRILVELKKLRVGPSNMRLQKKADLAILAVRRYSSDLRYRFLYDRIADFFACLLASDVEHMKAGNLDRIGLAAKWCPSLDSSFDRSTLLCETVARLMFPKDSHPDYAALEEAHYAYRVRTRLRREVLVPLRKALELPEVYMSACRWGSLPYGRIASSAMKNHARLFDKHDSTKFEEYLERVKTGKAKLAAGALLPHEILAAAYDKGPAGDVAELQWMRLVEEMSLKGKLKNCIAVCNVTAGMEGQAMSACTALGLLISELSEEPWKGRVITYSDAPQLHKIEGETLMAKARFIRTMEYGGYGDLLQVFDRLLQVAALAKLDSEQMVKRVFVFGDSEFDHQPNWDSAYEAICCKFEECGYGSCMPEIVFWNLRAGTAAPASPRQKGVALVSGFSKNLVRVFLERDGVLSPEDIMDDAISGEEYQKLEVFD